MQLEQLSNLRKVPSSFASNFCIRKGKLQMSLKILPQTSEIYHLERRMSPFLNAKDYLEMV